MSNEGNVINKIVEVHRDSSGEIELVKLDDGRIMSRTEAVTKMNSGELFLADTLTAESSDGEVYLRSMPDGDRTNNLSNLPEISDYTGYTNGPNMVVERTIVENRE